MYKNKKIKLYGFNNLTKNLTLCIYNTRYINNIKKTQYINYINNIYNTKKLIKILKKTCHAIDAKILNIAKQDYDPQGASVTILISENYFKKNINKNKILTHLDKSHICIHTYPEGYIKNNICTSRIDIEISTCGIISPLKIINYLIIKLNSDIITIDYKIRGFTRDINGIKHFIDHKINSIQNFINKKIKKKYDFLDINIYQENIFYTKMIVKKINIKKYIFDYKKNKHLLKNEKKIITKIWKEMKEIFYGENIS